MNVKDFAGAAALAEQTLAQNPEQPNIWLSMARCKDALGDKNGAVTAYKEYLELKPTNIRETASLIQVLSEAGRCDEAVAEAKAAENRFAPQGRKAMGQIWFTHGMALECSTDFEGALNKYQKAAGSGDPQWGPLGAQNVERMQNTVDYEKAKKKKAQQGG